MHQKELARRVWEKAGLYRSKNARLRAFLAHFDATPGTCWPDVVNEVRAHYPELKAALVVPLWNSGDPLLRANLLRRADPSSPDEDALLQKFAASIRPERDPAELRAAATIDSPAVLARLGKLSGLSAESARAIALRREVLLAHEKAAQREQGGVRDAPPEKEAARPRRKTARKVKATTKRRRG
jgi:hypothetical protein